MTKVYLQDKFSPNENTHTSLELVYGLPSEAIQPEMFDFLKVVAIGAKKYAMNNWLEADGKRSSEKDMHDSMGHHWAESMVGKGKALDKDSKLDPLLHLACRALMLYTRRQRGIIHEDDKTS